MVLLISPQNTYATKRLVEEAGNLNVPLEVFDVKNLAAKNFEIDVEKYAALFVRFVHPYFSEIIELTKRFDAAGKYVVDRDFILSGFELSKKKMSEQLEKAGLPIPKTNYGLRITDYEFPFVLKWIYGFGGHHTYLVRNDEDLKSISEKYPKEELLVQEYIKTDAEFTVFTVGEKALGKILQFQIADYGLGIDANKYSILKSENHPEIIRLAERAAQATAREFAKIDILQKDNQFYILEVNRSASLLPFEPYSKINVAKKYIEYIKNKI